MDKGSHYIDFQGMHVADAINELAGENVVGLSEFKEQNPLAIIVDLSIPSCGTASEILEELSQTFGFVLHYDGDANRLTYRRIA